MSEINGKKYRLPSLDIFQEFALASSISPILSLMSLQNDKAKLAEKFPQAFTALAGEMGLSRESKDEIIRMCMTGVMREDAGNWFPVMTDGRFMYDDMKLNVVLKLVFDILVEHRMIDFFSDPHSNSKDKPARKPVSSGSDTRTTG